MRRSQKRSNNDTIQAKYDDETAHGINEANQKEWMQKIEKKLGELGN